MSNKAVCSPNKDHILVKGDTQSYCPFIMPIPAKDRFGQTQLTRIPCSTACPHARIDTSEVGVVEGDSIIYKTWVITCGGESVFIPLESVEEFKPEEPRSEGNIIQM